MKKYGVKLKHILSIILVLIISFSVNTNTSLASEDEKSDYTKIDEDVYGKFGESHSALQNDYRGYLNLTEYQEKALKKSGYKLSKRKSRIITTEMGRALIGRFYKDGNFIESVYYRRYANTGGPLLNFNYYKIQDIEMDKDGFYELVGNKTAIGLYDRLDKNSFKNDGKSLVKSVYFDIITEETSERVYMFSVKDNSGNIYKYIFKTVGQLELKPEKNPGDKIEITYNTRINGIEVPSEILNYGETPTAPENPIYKKTETNSGVYTKTFGGWFYDNRTHSVPMDYTKPVTRDIDLHISWNDNLRLRGKSRFETARLVGERFKSADIAVIVNGNSFPDALSASPLATASDGPIILSSKDRIDNDNVQLLKRLGVKKAYIIGLEGTLSEKVENQLLGLNIITERIGGSNRIETSVKVAEEVFSITGNNNSVTFANGFDFPDALSSTIIANRYNNPILLGNSNSIDENVISLVKNNNILDIYIVGGENSITNKIEENFSSKNIKRISGSNRYKTSLEVVKYVNYHTHSVILASGLNYADGIVAGPYAGLTQLPILLVPDTDSIDEDTRNYFKDLGLHETITIGSDRWVTDALQEEISNVTLNK